MKRSEKVPQGRFERILSKHRKGCICGGSLYLGRTVRHRLAWFCMNPECKWYNVAVRALYVSHQ